MHEVDVHITSFAIERDAECRGGNTKPPTTKRQAFGVTNGKPRKKAVPPVSIEARGKHVLHPKHRCVVRPNKPPTSTSAKHGLGQAKNIWRALPNNLPSQASPLFLKEHGVSLPLVKCVEKVVGHHAKLHAPKCIGNEDAHPGCWAVVKILFVENHLLFAQTVIEQFLTGHEIMLVPTIAEAKGAMSPTFDAVLVDYDLPDGKGTEVVLALRAMGFRGAIVAVSSREEGNDELRAAGATRTCSKKDFRAICAALGV